MRATHPIVRTHAQLVVCVAEADSGRQATVLEVARQAVNSLRLAVGMDTVEVGVGKVTPIFVIAMESME